MAAIAGAVETIVGVLGLDDASVPAEESLDLGDLPADSVSRVTATMWWTGLSSFGPWHVKSAGSKMPTLSGMAWRRPG